MRFLVTVRKLNVTDGRGHCNISRPGPSARREIIKAISSKPMIRNTYMLRLACWSLTSLCHSNGHIETMPAREINPFTALTRIRSQFLRTQGRATISEWKKLRLTWADPALIEGGGGGSQNNFKRIQSINNQKV